jgi:hypothetical protein
MWCFGSTGVVECDVEDLVGFGEEDGRIGVPPSVRLPGPCSPACRRL